MKTKAIVVAALATVMALALPAAAAPATGSVVGWARVNTPGFGDPRNALGPLAVFNGQLYAGTWSNADGHPVQVWRTADGKTWTAFHPPVSSATESLYDLQVHEGYLYVGLDRDDGAGGEIWRTDSVTWKRVVAGGFGNAANVGVNALASFGGHIYAVTVNNSTGPEIWRSASGDVGEWSQVSTPALSSGVIAQDVVLEAINGQLYLGLGRRLGPNLYRGELWRSADGQTWTAVFTDGLGNPNNSIVGGLAEFQGQLYVGIRNVVQGGEVWRLAPSSTWQPVVTGGLGDVVNGRPYGLFAFQNRLYLVVSNLVSGAQVWVSDDGSSWRQVVSGGWGNPTNWFADYFDKGSAVFNGRLYIATLNRVSGGEVWLQLDQTVFLPVALR
ncbi:MAG: hypothetical protein NZ528_12020 [Caldilineales bacterium]|nr:hypothetical protein [Caldilineales bacterium]MDW8318537.1 hypothetical protein [Anaerolineae bacterium]